MRVLASYPSPVPPYLSVGSASHLVKGHGAKGLGSRRRPGGCSGFPNGYLPLRETLSNAMRTLSTFDQRRWLGRTCIAYLGGVRGLVPPLVTPRHLTSFLPKPRRIPSPACNEDINLLYYRSISILVAFKWQTLCHNKHNTANLLEHDCPYARNTA